MLTAAVLMETLSAPASKKLAHVLYRANATADGQRHEAGFGRTLDDIENRAAIFMARGDVEEAEFVCTRCIIGNGAFDGIASVAQSTKFTPLTTRPFLTSRQGITRLLSIGCIPGRTYERQRFGWIEAAIIKGTPRDGACKTCAIGLQEPFDVANGGEAPDAMTGMLTASASSSVASTFNPAGRRRAKCRYRRWRQRLRPGSGGQVPLLSSWKRQPSLPSQQGRSLRQCRRRRRSG